MGAVRPSCDPVRIAPAATTSRGLSTGGGVSSPRGVIMPAGPEQQDALSGPCALVPPRSSPTRSRRAEPAHGGDDRGSLSAGRWRRRPAGCRTALSAFPLCHGAWFFTPGLRVHRAPFYIPEAESELVAASTPIQRLLSFALFSWRYRDAGGLAVTSVLFWGRLAPHPALQNGPRSWVGSGCWGRPGADVV